MFARGVNLHKKTTMTSLKKNSVALLFTLLCVLSVASQAKKLDRKNLLDPKLSKLQRLPKFPLLTKLKEAGTSSSLFSIMSEDALDCIVMPSSPSPPPPDNSEAVLSDEEIDSEPVVKASGVRVVPIRNPSPPDATVVKASPPEVPTVEISPDCTDIAPDNIYTCAEQVLVLFVLVTVLTLWVLESFRKV